MLVTPRWRVKKIRKQRKPNTEERYNNERNNSHDYETQKLKQINPTNPDKQKTKTKDKQQETKHNQNYTNKNK